jgi:hypothetical protein
MFLRVGEIEDRKQTRADYRMILPSDCVLLLLTVNFVNAELQYRQSLPIPSQCNHSFCKFPPLNVVLSSEFIL